MVLPASCRQIVLSRIVSSCRQDAGSTLVDGQAADRLAARGLFALRRGRAGTESESLLHVLKDSRLFGPNVDADHGVNAHPAKRVTATHLEQLHMVVNHFAKAAMHRFVSLQSLERPLAETVEEPRRVN